MVMDTLKVREVVKFFLLMISALLLQSCSSCYADENFGKSTQCVPDADKSTWSDTLNSNLNIVLNSLYTNVNIHNGFYKANEGKGSDKLYGLIQCRGDISGNDCTNCTQEAIKLVSQTCEKSKKAAIWLTWCFLRYSSEEILGNEKSSMDVGFSNPDIDYPAVTGQGFSFMETLASKASIQPMMFMVSVLDVGQNGKRYGLAQCIRDSSKEYCKSCLNDLLVFSDYKKTGWEIYNLGCSMLYYDFQFYNNVSIPAVTSAQIPIRGEATIGKTTMTTMVISLAFLTTFVS